MVFINTIIQKIINLFSRKENNYPPLSLEEFYENNPIMDFYNYDGVSFTGCTVSDFEIYSSTLSMIKYHVPKPKRFKLKPKYKYYQEGVEVQFDDIDLGKFWSKQIFDENDNIIYYENDRGKWYKAEFDDNGNEIYWEDCYGYIKDNRLKN